MQLAATPVFYDWMAYDFEKKKLKLREEIKNLRAIRIISILTFSWKRMYNETEQA